MDAVLTEIPLAEALRYLGVRGEPDGILLADLDRCTGLLLAEVRPRVCWRLFDLQEDGTLAGTSFRPEGQDIHAHLEGCSRVIALAATLGMEAENLLQRARLHAISDALLLDALGSAAVERLCDLLCEELAARLAPEKLTARFSPGYGDFPLSQQRELCEVLNVGRILGISLTPGDLMIPRKSVTALIGVSASPAHAEGGKTAGCGSCAFSGSCTHAKEGTPCGKY